MAQAHHDQSWSWAKAQTNKNKIQELGKFAVQQQMRKHNWLLEFENVFDAWTLHIAGVIYRLRLNAKLGGDITEYEAFVWQQHSGCQELMSFQELEE